jgi:hypothetical protein
VFDDGVALLIILDLIHCQLIIIIKLKRFEGGSSCRYQEGVKGSAYFVGSGRPILIFDPPVFIEIRS